MELSSVYETNLTARKPSLSTGVNVSSVSKAFDILETVAGAGGRGLPFSRIVEATGIPKASAHRLLRELADLSVLAFDPDTRNYRGGILLARLGADVDLDYDLRRVARPHLEALQRETGHVATLGLRNGDEGVYVDKIEPNDLRIRLHSEIGKAFPLHSTGMGKVLLAYASTEDIRRISKRQLEAYTRNTITDGKALRKELEHVREQGYAFDREEITRGLMCVAAPIHDAHGALAGAMSCTFPSYVAEERNIDAEVEAVVRHARAASGLYRHDDRP
jgi:DNA-binding IclR family transcriptional regulator